MNEIYALISKPSVQFGFVCAVVVLLAAAVWLTLRVRRLSGTYLTLTSGLDKRNLESILRVHMKSLQETAERVEILEHLAEDLSAKLGFTIQRVGLVNFDAFADVGGQLSFSIALLDDHKSGVVISHLYGRNESTTYIKEVKQGIATRHLTHEEEKAIATAAPAGEPSEHAMAG